MLFYRPRKWWLARIDQEPDGPIGAGASPAAESGIECYRMPLSVRICHALGFHSPRTPTLTREQWEQGWNEEVYARTMVTLSFGDRLRVLLFGRLALMTVVSAKVRIPEAITEVSVSVPIPGYD